MNAAQVLALATAIRAEHWQIRGGCCSICPENYPCDVSRLAEYVVTTLSDQGTVATAPTEPCTCLPCSLCKTERMVCAECRNCARCDESHAAGCVGCPATYA